jgi:hypothetical protein
MSTSAVKVVFAVWIGSLGALSLSAQDLGPKNWKWGEGDERDQGNLMTSETMTKSRRHWAKRSWRRTACEARATTSPRVTCPRGRRVSPRGQGSPRARSRDGRHDPEPTPTSPERNMY